MKISLTKLFAQDGKSEKYEIPLTSETFSIGGQDYLLSLALRMKAIV